MTFPGQSPIFKSFDYIKSRIQTAEFHIKLKTKITTTHPHQGKLIKSMFPNVVVVGIHYIKLFFTFG